MDENVVMIFQAFRKPYPKFCMALKRLLKDAVSSFNSHRFVYMWSDYLCAMSKVGQNIFTDNIYNDPEEDEVEDAWDILFLDGYADMLVRILQGAEILLMQVKLKGYRRAISEIQTLENRYNSLLKIYKKKHRKIKDRDEKREFIYRCKEIFEMALDILMDVREQEQRRANKRDFFLFVERYQHPRLHKIRSVFKKLFIKIKNAKIRKNCAKTDKLISKI